MCGIIGYIGGENSAGKLATGLKNLEYRGYDSAGIALVEDGVDVYKQEGTIDDLRIPSAKAQLGIGHTRWSTHGKPTDENAHPHTDCTGSVAVVHNGIIANYQDLKAELAGHVFKSNTDTEVIPHLIEEELATGAELLPAVKRVLSRLDGSFAIAVAHAETDGIIVARQDSPLVVGHGVDEMYVGSDVTAFIDYTKRVSYLHDGDVAHVTSDGVEVFNDGERVDRPVETVDWDASSAGKAGYDNYMHKEIHEQPNALRQALSGRIDTLAGEVDLDISLDDEEFTQCEHVQIVACGTSYHAGLCAKRLIESVTDIPVTVTIASEYEVHDGFDPDTTIAIAITQSGETADTLAAIRTAIGYGMTTMAITNTVGSTVTREVDETVHINAGPEIGVAATKTFLSQVATATLLSVFLGRTRETIAASEATTILESLRSLPSAVQEILDDERQIRQLAREYADSDSFFFIGRKTGHAVALESALKLKEISYDHAEGFAAGELKHGPLALVTPRTPVLAILTEGTAAAETLNNVKEVESRGAPVIGLSSDETARSFCDHVVEIPEIGRLEPIAANVALQLFAYHVAKVKDRNIDKPRNLAKSVTVD